MRKSRLYRYYGLYYGNKPKFERQIERYLQDPIRYVEGANENVSIKTIKGRRLG